MGMVSIEAIPAIAIVITSWANSLELIIWENV